MQVTHFLKRNNCKVSLQCVKYVKSKENGKPRNAGGPLRTAVAKAIILPLWGLRGIASWRLFFHILAEGGDVIDGRIVDIMLELAEV